MTIKNALACDAYWCEQTAVLDSDASELESAIKSEGWLIDAINPSHHYCPKCAPEVAEEIEALQRARMQCS